MRFIFLGAPGVGKGTHAGHLAKDLSLPHISTGDIFRSAVSRGTKVGMEAKAFMDRGELVPDEVVIAIVMDRLKEQDCAAGYLLDGFPRTIAQAQALDKKLEELDQAIDHAVYFVADEPSLIQRLTGRRFCKDCSAAYHVVNQPSQKEGVCDACSGVLFQRDDDKEETIKNRLQVFKDQSAPLFAYYQDRGILREINTGGPIEQTYQALLKATGVQG